ncbi:low temperature requirement protein A [Gaetbulibacter aestuarii]|uniref:Low temperature requirement protein A n=1 Tax=Gaetbulibacter aestuarii TaxID=1502358 RepID=A0ABW7MX66_9FLAO
MKAPKRTREWWGPPKKFTVNPETRKVSWLELFFDLVYVIAIAKITHHLSEGMHSENILEFIFFFILIFWGWLNGSMYHDLHGAEGWRTRFMTLWQMLIVSALVITLDSPAESFVFNVTTALILLQIFIIYLWWSVGLYDKEHRKLNRPYSIIYLAALALMVTTLFLKDPFIIQVILFSSLFLNYLPPFVLYALSKVRTNRFVLSESMTERLGLFTIIIFGEVIAGVISGVTALHQLNLKIWINFSLAVILVFALWWLFFTLISDRRCKKGMLNSSILQILYIPTLLGLDLLAMAFSKLFTDSGLYIFDIINLKQLSGFSMSLFLFGMFLMTFVLKYAEQYYILRKRIQWIIFSSAFILMIFSLVNIELSLGTFLFTLLLFVLSIIILLNYQWYGIQVKKNKAIQDQN